MASLVPPAAKRARTEDTDVDTDALITAALNRPTPSPPPGFVFRFKWGLPERDGDDEGFIEKVREMCAEGGDQYAVMLPGNINLGHVSRGADRDFYTRGPGGEGPISWGDAAMQKQFTDAWCLAQTRQDLIGMYMNMYGGDDAIGLLPGPAMALADDLVCQLNQRGRMLGVHDPRRLAPMVEHVRDMANNITEEGAPGTFDWLVGLLEALDAKSRGVECDGWTYVNAMAGPIVSEFGALMLTAAACVLLCTFHLGRAGAPGSPERRAFATALAMRENLSGGVDETAREKDMMVRLGKLEKVLKDTAASASADGAAPSSPPRQVRPFDVRCELSELVSALNEFIGKYGDEVADE